MHFILGDDLKEQLHTPITVKLLSAHLSLSSIKTAAKKAVNAASRSSFTIGSASLVQAQISKNPKVCIKFLAH